MPGKPEEKLTEKRCRGCNYLLAKVDLKIAVVEIKCPKCGTINKEKVISDIKPEGPLTLFKT